MRAKSVYYRLAEMPRARQKKHGGKEWMPLLDILTDGKNRFVQALTITTTIDDIPMMMSSAE
jgi:hypothetical protein